MSSFVLKQTSKYGKAQVKKWSLFLSEASVSRTQRACSLVLPQPQPGVLPGGLGTRPATLPVTTLSQKSRNSERSAACLRSHGVEGAEPGPSPVDPSPRHLPVHHPATLPPRETPAEKATIPSHAGQSDWLLLGQVSERVGGEYWERPCSQLSRVHALGMTHPPERLS